MSKVWLAVTIVYIFHIHAAPVEEIDININANALQFLKEKNYLQTFSQIGHQGTLKQVVDAIKDFQSFAGIPVTGQIDAITEEWMQKARCGRGDKHNEEMKRRKKRFLLQGSSWRNLEVSWALENSNDDGITDNQVRDVMRRSLKKWQEVTNLKFIELVRRPINSAQIRVRFERGSHGDPYNFDGRGGTLAHAFYPASNEGLSGDVHFDDDEIYTVDANSGRDKRKLLWVTVHELGHSIGLEHSNLKGAVMFPWYQHFEGSDFNLTFDDIQGIQSIYGSPVRTTVKTVEVVTKATPSPKPKTTVKVRHRCTDRMNAVLLGRDEQTYAFNGEHLYILHKDGAGVGINTGPFQIKNYFSTLTNVDAVFRRSRDNMLVFFHGDSFSVYDSTRLRHPARKISYGFQGVDDNFNNIDGAVVDSRNDYKLYLFKGDEYWRFTQLSNYDYSLDAKYPKLISANWKGVPSSIDAVFQWSNGHLYFFKGDQYYRWNRRRNEVHSGYPIKSTRSFLVCPSQVPGDLKSDAVSMRCSYEILISSALVIFIGVIYH